DTPMTLDEMMAYHKLGNVRYANVLLVAGEHAYQAILDHGYTLVQARFSERGAASVSELLDHSGHQLIHFAAAMNQPADTIWSLLSSGAVIDAARHSGATPLYIAAQIGHTACVEQLLAAGATVDAARYDGATPLHAATENGQTTCVEQLLAAGAT